MPSLVPSVPLVLDRERHLRLDNAALFRAERELSKLWSRKVSVLQTLIDPETLGLNDLSILLWCGLLHEDADLSLSQVQVEAEALGGSREFGAGDVDEFVELVALARNLT